MTAPSPLAWPLDQLLTEFVTEPRLLDQRPVRQLTLNSRTATADSLFLACCGRQHHGLEFAKDAVDQGCTAIAAEPDAAHPLATFAQQAQQLKVPVVAVERLSARASALAARFYGDPSAELEILGITGTNGKTSVSHYLAQALGYEQRCAFLGTLGGGYYGDFGECQLDTAPTLTTPDAVTLQQVLSRLRHDGAVSVAMEVSSHALDQHRIAALHLSHAILTNLSRDHLDYHRDMFTYAATKARLFRQPGLKWRILNADDTLGRTLLGEHDPRLKTACYSLAADFDPKQPLLRHCALWLHVQEFTALPTGMHLSIRSSEGEGELISGLVGRFNAANVLAVLAVLLSRGAGLKKAFNQIARLRAVPGRMECFGGGTAPLVVVDYAHTPDALEQALTHLRDHCHGRLITVFGCGGERDPGKRPLMGRIAERLSDQVIITDDNPRHEDGDAIIAAIGAGMNHPEQARIERQRGLAIRIALARAGLADVVLVAGKGHETTQDMGALKVRFSDRAQVVQALAEWQEGQR